MSCVREPRAEKRAPEKTGPRAIKWLGGTAPLVATIAATTFFACIGDIGGGGDTGGGGGGAGGKNPDGGTAPATGASAPGAGAGASNFQPAASGLRRLTLEEYRNSITDLVPAGIVLPTDLPTDVPSQGFTTIGVTTETNDSLALIVEKFEAAARNVANQIFTTTPMQESFVGCTGTPDAACIQKWIRAYTLRAWRRPATDDEVTRYTQIVSDVAATLGSPWDGLHYATAAILSSPYFFYRVEIGSPDPTQNKWNRYDDYEMASRLSYFLWSSTPDDALLAAASRGELTTVEGVRTQGQRLLASPRARGAIVRFFREHLGLATLVGLGKDATVYPKMNADLAASMATEIEQDVADIAVDRNADIRELFDGRSTFIDARLADLYGLPAPAAAGFTKITFGSDVPRAGFLTSGAFLATQARETRASAVFRGVFINERLLCRPIGSAPNNVNAAGVDQPIGTSAPQTMRQLLETMHRTDSSCAACHSRIDPLGLPLEHFDGIGAYREKDQGLTIDATGSLDGVAFDGAAGLGKVLRDSPATAACLATQIYRFATGHLEVAGEAPVLTDLATRFQTSGYLVQNLMIEVAASEGFRLAGSPR